MTIHDLNIAEEALKNDLQKDLILKIISHTKQMVLLHNKETSQLREIIKQNYKIGYKFASMGDDGDSDGNLQVNFSEKKVTLLVDTTEYTLKEVAEIFDISYKHCNRLFAKYKIPLVRREKHGGIFLGKTIKKHFCAKKSNNILKDCY